MAAYTWKKTEEGYRASDGRARLVRRGKAWVLITRGGAEHALPRRASFDHAEGLIARLGLR